MVLPFLNHKRPLYCIHSLLLSQYTWYQTPRVYGVSHSNVVSLASTQLSSPLEVYLNTTLFGHHSTTISSFGPCQCYHLLTHHSIILSLVGLSQHYCLLTCRCHLSSNLWATTTNHFLFWQGEELVVIIVTPLHHCHHVCLSCKEAIWHLCHSFHGPSLSPPPHRVNNQFSTPYSQHLTSRELPWWWQILFLPNSTFLEKCSIGRTISCGRPTFKH